MLTIFNNIPLNHWFHKIDFKIYFNNETLVLNPGAVYYNITVS